MAAFDDNRKLEMYRFFLVAFDAAPGVTYLDQLKEAVEAGLTTREIVNVFTTKQQFKSVYPDSLSSQEFATRLVDRVVGASASTAAKQTAVADVVQALGSGLTRGDVIYNVFGNLATRVTDPGKPGFNPEDPYLGVAQQFAKKVAVAQYFTETLKGDSILLSVLQGVVSSVTKDSVVTSAASIENIIRGFDSTRKLDMYRFFLVAFDAAPGVTYFNQLKQAVESGLSTKEIVNIFTTKPQFLSAFPSSLTPTEFATRLVDRVVGTLASSQAKASAVTDIVSALNGGWSRGDVIFTVFGNLAARETDPSKPAYNANDPYIAVARQLSNAVKVAEYYTEVLKGDSTNLLVLQNVVSRVTDTSNVSTVAALDALSKATESGRIVDGYIRGATVFADADGDGILDPGEATAISDAEGRFTLSGASGNIVASGGTDLSTNLPFSGILKAPPGSSVVNPLTTVVTAVAGDGGDIQAAQAKVAQAFGLSATLPLTSFDPLAVASSPTATAAEKAAAVSVQKAAAIVANVMVQTASVVASTGTASEKLAAANQTAAVIAGLISSSVTAVDLTRADTLKTVLTTTAEASGSQARVAGLVDQVVQVIAANNTAVAQVSASGTDPLLALQNVAKVQVVADAAGKALAQGVSSGSLSSVVSGFTGENLTQAVTTQRRRRRHRRLHRRRLPRRRWTRPPSARPRLHHSRRGN